jgi:hypothetical protein
MCGLRAGEEDREQGAGGGSEEGPGGGARELRSHGDQPPEYADWSKSREKDLTFSPVEWVETREREPEGGSEESGRRWSARRHVGAAGRGRGHGDLRWCVLYPQFFKFLKRKKLKFGGRQVIWFMSTHVPLRIFGKMMNFQGICRASSLEARGQ